MTEDNRLTHLRADGSATMVDVSDKAVVRREALAESVIALRPETIAAIADGATPKGDVLAVARIAGIQAAKKTAELVPLCHPLPLTKVTVDFEMETAGIRIRCRARTDARTGVEMEALTGASVAALAIYDMCKAIDDAMVVRETRLVEKKKESPC